MNKNKDLLISIVESGILIAMAAVIEMICRIIPFFEMPQGGTISFCMLPLFIIGFRRGWKYSIVSCFIYSIIQFMMDGFVFHVGSIFFDYIFAFTVLGFAGFFKNERKTYKLCLIIFFLSFVRYLLHSLSGIIFFSEYAYIPEGLNWNINVNMIPFVYSFIIYNLPYMALSTIVCIILIIVLSKSKNNVLYYKVNE